MRDKRNTIQKQLVRNAVIELKSHPTAEEIYKYISSKYSNISKTTVYNNLKILSEDREIYKVENPNQPTRYDYCIKNHYHLCCRVCGKVFDSEMPYNEEQLKIFNQFDDFLIEDYSLTLNGVCPLCNKRKENDYE